MLGVEEARRLKEEIRRKIWSRMVAEGVALPPFPVEGRIPNFRGAELAARRLASDELFTKAEVVFCNPDSPQRHVREAVLRSGKLLIMASPRLRSGFIILDPRAVPRSAYAQAATIAGAFKYGKIVTTRVPAIDLKVAGSVAVSPDGGRVGKGGGFSDLEFAILKTLGAVDDSTPVVTTVHDMQVVESVPMLRHDVPVDAIYTPTRALRVEQRRPKPPGVIWELLSERDLEEIPLLRELRSSLSPR